MRELKDVLDWNLIVFCNRLIDSFIRDHLNTLDISLVCLFETHLNPERLQEFKVYLEELKTPKPYLPFKRNKNFNICFESTKKMV